MISEGMVGVVIIFATLFSSLKIIKRFYLNEDFFLITRNRILGMFYYSIPLLDDFLFIENARKEMQRNFKKLISITIFAVVVSVITFILINVPFFLEVIEGGIIAIIFFSITRMRNSLRDIENDWNYMQNSIRELLFEEKDIY